jgi:large subunit ribosomal protein L4
MNKKARKAAIKSALSLFYKGNKLTVVNNFDLAAVSTKSFNGVLGKFELQKALLIIDSENRNLQLSARNIKNVKVLYVDALNIFDMMKFQNVVMTQEAVKRVEGALTA